MVVSTRPFTYRKLPTATTGWPALDKASGCIYRELTTPRTRKSETAPWDKKQSAIHISSGGWGAAAWVSDGLHERGVVGSEGIAFPTLKGA